MTRAPSRIHTGSVEARGFWFDEAVLGERETRRRLLEFWQPEAALYEWLGGHLMLLPASQRIDTSRAPGTVLCEVGDGVRVLSSFAATRDDIQDSTDRAGDVLHLHTGRIRVFRPSEATRVDASQWIALDDFVVERVATIMQPPAEVPPLAAPPPRREARSLFGSKVPGESPEAASLRRLIQGLTTRGGPGGWGNAIVEAAGLLGAVLLGGLRALLGGNRARASGAPKSPKALSLFSRFMLMSRLSRIAGWRQAGYMRRMLDILESGDLARALRHAIPLGGSAANDFSWGLPGPRLDLSISGSVSGGRSMFLGGGLHEYLEQLYRGMFERLDHMGRVDEAAFVVAELLQSSEEAVLYLEKHGRLRQAAELAEARELDPGLVVRLWIRARDPKRAFIVARRKGAFAAAVAMFEHRNEHEEAAKLRVVWASTLAEGGRYAAAIDAVWPVGEARRLAMEWMQRARDVGGLSNARILARKLTLMPERFEETRASILELLEDRSRDAARLREAFAIELLAQERSQAISVIARQTYRAILRDRSLGMSTWNRHQLERLVKRSRDAALRADVVTLMPEEGGRLTLKHVESPHELTIAGAGLIPVWDARMLPRDRVLVALGDAGLRILNREGRTVRHLDVPARHLVLSDAGNRALALMPRKDIMVISRIDLESMTAKVWHETPLKNFVERFDGSMWFVVIKDRLLAMDTLSSRFEALWSTPLPGEVEVIVRDEDALHLSIEVDGDLQVWRYELPALFLRDRRAFPSGFDLPCVYSFRPGPHHSRPGTVCAVFPREFAAKAGPVGLEYRERFSSEPPTGFDLTESDAGAYIPVLAPEWTVLRYQEGSDVHVVVLDTLARQRRAEIRLKDSDQVSAHIDFETLVLAETCGRITSLDLRTGAVLHRIQT